MKFWTAGFFNSTVGDFGYVLSASHIATGGEDNKNTHIYCSRCWRMDFQMRYSFLWFFHLFIRSVHGSLQSKSADVCRRPLRGNVYDSGVYVGVAWGASISSVCDYWLFHHPWHLVVGHPNFLDVICRLDCCMYGFHRSSFLHCMDYGVCFTMFGSGMEVERARVFLNWGWGGCLGCNYPPIEHGRILPFYYFSCTNYPGLVWSWGRDTSITKNNVLEIQQCCLNAIVLHC